MHNYFAFLTLFLQFVISDITHLYMYWYVQSTSLSRCLYRNAGYKKQETSCPRLTCRFVYIYIYTSEYQTLGTNNRESNPLPTLLVSSHGHLADWCWKEMECWMRQGLDLIQQSNSLLFLSIKNESKTSNPGSRESFAICHNLLTILIMLCSCGHKQTMWEEVCFAFFPHVCSKNKSSMFSSHKNCIK